MVGSQMHLPIVCYVCHVMVGRGGRGRIGAMKYEGRLVLLLYVDVFGEVMNDLPATTTWQSTFLSVDRLVGCIQCINDLCRYIVW